MGPFGWLTRFLARRPQATLGVSPFPTGTGPSRLIVLRHSEKSGDKRDPHLSLAGRKRAEQLATYIPQKFGQPQFLIAARTSMRSRRPVETLEPLAATLALEIRAKLDDGASTALIEVLRDKQRQRGKIGVICWRHSALPRLIDALGAPPGTYPEQWDENDYTTIVDITYRDTGTEVRQLRMPF